jgi:uncharacterized membrane protein
MKKFDDLALNGEIDLYERTLIRKTSGGRCELYREGGSAGWQTITGALIGSLVGLVGGPIGSVIGLMSGAVVGSAISDREQRDFGKEIKKSVEDEIPPGAVAIVAHIGERDPELVDSILKRFDSHPFRSDIRNISGGDSTEK